MKLRQLCTMLVIGVGPLSLTACGGGDISSASSVPPPPPTATPTPTPTPAPAPIAPAHLGLVSVGPFAVLAVGDSYKTNAAGANRTQLTAPAPQDAHFSYNAATNTYQISLPDFQSGTLVQTGYDGSAGQPAIGSGSHVSVGATTAVQPLFVHLPVPGTQASPYSYTSFGSWTGQMALSTAGELLKAEGRFAYGIPTGSGDVPLTGSAIYVAEVIGSSADASELSISGSATFEFNFGAGTLNGHLNPVIYDYLAYGSAGLSLGRYDFVNTVYANGSTSFSGGLSQVGVAGNGSFSGQFTGPNAAELMSSWSAPYRNPYTNQVSQIFGVLVGKH